MARFLVFIFTAAMALPAAQLTSKGSSYILLEAAIDSPLSYADVCARLDEYCREQVGRSAAETMPETGVQQRFDLWHEMWMQFGQRMGGTSLTLQRMTERESVRHAKTQMLEVAGHINGQMPLTYRELPALESAAGEVFAGRHTVAAALAKSNAAIRPLPLWKSGAVFASADPIALIRLEAPGADGLSSLRVTMAKASDAKQMLARVSELTGGPRICVVVDEMADLDREIRKTAEEMERQALIRGSAIVVARANNIAPYEAQVRAAPVMRKRIEAARQRYAVRYRVDRDYRKTTVKWTALANYDRLSGKSDGEQSVAEAAQSGTRKSEGRTLATLSVRVETLPPGAYRIQLDGETAQGEAVRIDEAIYWYDGKSFQEL